MSQHEEEAQQQESNDEAEKSSQEPEPKEVSDVELDAVAGGVRVAVYKKNWRSGG